MRTTINTATQPIIAVVIPCYKVKNTILTVIQQIGTHAQRIYIVDDACPEKTGEFVKQHDNNPHIQVITNEKNLGVGGAMLAGYRQALSDGADIIVKIDGDLQMNPKLIPKFIDPIIAGQADYTKGNRFYDLTYLRRMPVHRVLGNAILSFMAKLSTGYWDIFDSTNGYTAIHANVLRHLPLKKISLRFFFETDMLFRLNTIRAVVIDIPMVAVYENETSHLRISKIIFEFMYKHIRNFGKRIFYNYFLRDFSIASLELVFGIVLMLFGLYYGTHHWLKSLHDGLITPAGTVMLAALPLLVGLQLLLAFFAYDMTITPKRCLHKFGGKSHET